jgi:hypothetical protein
MSSRAGNRSAGAVLERHQGDLSFGVARGNGIDLRLEVASSSKACDRSWPCGFCSPAVLRLADRPRPVIGIRLSDPA